MSINYPIRRRIYTFDKTQEMYLATESFRRYALTYLATEPLNSRANPFKAVSSTMSHKTCAFARHIDASRSANQTPSYILDSYIYSQPSVNERLIYNPCASETDKIANIRKQINDLDKKLSPPTTTPTPSKGCPPNAPSLPLLHSFDDEIFPDWATGKYAIQVHTSPKANQIVLHATCPMMHSL